jgi:hypothetical protein
MKSDGAVEMWKTGRPVYAQFHSYYYDYDSIYFYFIFMTSSMMNGYEPAEFRVLKTVAL